MTVRINHGKTSQDRFGFPRGRIDRRDSYNTIDSPTVKRVEIVALLLPVLSGISNQHGVIRGRGIILGPTNELDVKVVRKVGDNDGNRMRSLKPKPPSQIIRAIA